MCCNSAYYVILSVKHVFSEEIMNLKARLGSFIGNRAFYKMLIAIMLPIMIQTGITNFVNMLDNVMIGSVGECQTTGVAVANQLIFVFNLCIFGAVSGAGIFGAQFFGKGDHEGLRHTLRFKLISTVLLTVIAIVIFIFAGDSLIGLYLKGEGSAEDVSASLGYGRVYLNVMLIGLIPYTIAQCYASTLRETGQTVLPMYAGLAAVFINLVLNWVLIFGNLGAPRLGVQGGAIATVISRFAEMIIVMLGTHLKSNKNLFVRGLYKSVYVPGSLIANILKKGLPLLLNETMWAMGIAAANQCYSLRGLDVVAANNISQTFFNVFSVAFLTVGQAIGIILGQMLGANRINEAKDASRKLIAFSLFMSFIVGSVYFIAAEYIPHAYAVSNDVKQLATQLMRITAVVMPLDAFANASYFTLRSGGKTIITVLFDSCFVWCVTVAVASILVYYTTLPILALFGICQGLNIIKCIIGFILVKKGIWIQNIV